jgi:O-antigen/teichoic acid export membrane protein
MFKGITSLEEIMLLSIKILNIAFPLLAIPLIIKSFGFAIYGEFVFYQSIGFFVTAFLRLGTDIRSLRDFSVLKSYRSKHAYFSSVFSLQLFVLLLLILINIMGLIISGKIQYLYLILLTLIVSKESFYSVYYFVGINRLNNLLFVELVTKIVLLISLYILGELRTVSLVHLLSAHGICYAISGLFVLLFISKPTIRFNIVTMLYEIKKHAIFIFARLLTTFKDRTAHLIIGASLDFDMVALYDLVLKFVSIGVLPIGVKNQIALLRKNNVILTDILLAVLIGVAFYTITTVFNEEIASLLSMEGIMLESIVEYASLGIVILSIGSIFANEGMLKKEKDGAYLIGIGITVVFYLSGLLGLGIFFEVTWRSLVALMLLTYCFEFLYRGVILFFAWR